MGETTGKGGFTVTDRRSFSEGGEPRDPAQSPPPATDPAPAAPGAPNLPAVDFHTFVLSLGSSALLHLGELEHPDVGAPQKDLPLAKHTIDILVMNWKSTTEPTGSCAFASSIPELLTFTSSASTNSEP